MLCSSNVVCCCCGGGGGCSNDPPCHAMANSTEFENDILLSAFCFHRHRCPHCSCVFPSVTSLSVDDGQAIRSHSCAQTQNTPLHSLSCNQTLSVFPTSKASTSAGEYSTSLAIRNEGRGISSIYMQWGSWNSLHTQVTTSYGHHYSTTTIPSWSPNAKCLI